MLEIPKYLQVRFRRNATFKAAVLKTKLYTRSNVTYYALSS
jgi:hypothetical protein